MIIKLNKRIQNRMIFQSLINIIQLYAMIISIVFVFLMIEIDDSSKFCGNWVSSNGVSRSMWPAWFRAETTLILTEGNPKVAHNINKSFFFFSFIVYECQVHVDEVTSDQGSSLCYSFLDIHRLSIRLRRNCYTTAEFDGKNNSILKAFLAVNISQGFGQ